MTTSFYARWCLVSASLGFMLWCPIAFVADLPLALIERLFLLAPLVIVPLGLCLIETTDRKGRHPFLYRMVVIAQPFCATALVLSFAFPPGLLAAALASGWILLTGFIALLGLSRFLPRGGYCLEEGFVDAGLIYIAVGGMWLGIYRLGIPFLGFSGILVLLTAVHFHYVGFAAPIVAGMAGRTLPAAPLFLRRLFYWIGAGIIAGVPLLALGIAFSPPLEMAAAVILSVSLWALALLFLTALLPRMRSALGRLLLSISAGSLLFSMALALVYAYGEYRGDLRLNIPRMAELHGVANALGFSLCGLLSFILLRPQSRAPLPGIPFSAFTRWTYIGPDYFKRLKAIAQTGSPPQGLTDHMEEYGSSMFAPDKLHPHIRFFYEKTNRHALVVYPDWKFGFRWAGKVYRWFADRVGQVGLPLALRRDERLIDSEILPLDDRKDGRQKVRAWIRTYSGTRKAVYVAAYANHSDGEQTYMNIAFPLPGGNLTSVLRLESARDEAGAGGLLLTTLSLPDKKGDEGVYLVTPFLPIRLPINETIRVWPIGKGAVPSPASRGIEEIIRVTARHDMWLLGMKFLALDYYIYETGRFATPGPSFF